MGDIVSNYIDKYSQEMEVFKNQVPCYITEAFPNLSLEEVEKMPTEKMMWYFSRARFILKNFRGFIPKEEQETNGVTPRTAKQGVNLNNGSYGDFPEARRMKQFMEGKLK